MWYTHDTGILLSHKKDEILPFVKTWMAFEGIMLSEASQTRKTNIIWFHSYVEYKIQTNKINESTNQPNKHQLYKYRE